MPLHPCFDGDEAVFVWKGGAAVEYRLHHKGTIPLHTERLLLRRFRPGDEEAMFQGWLCDPEAAKFMRWASYSSVEEARLFLEELLSGYECPDFYRWAIVPRETGKPAGILSLFTVSEWDLVCEPAYCIGRSWRGKGYAAEALRAVLGFAFREAGFNRAEAYHSLQNPASGRVMEKAGMKKEGEAPQKYRCSLGFQDCALYGITRSAWLAAFPEGEGERTGCLRGGKSGTAEA